MIRAAILNGALLLTLLSPALSEDWAVHVTGGSKVADDLAAGHALDNLGEVIPDSNIFHFKVPKHHRSRRDVDTLKTIHDSLESQSNVEWLEHQDQPLKRVKRVPMPPRLVEDFHPLVTRQSPKPICFVNTLASSPEGSKRCVFPFQYKDKSYMKCTQDHSTNGAPWCATEVRPNGEAVEGQWGDCDEESFHCLNLATGQKARPPPASQRQSLPQNFAGPRLPPGASFPQQRGPRPFPFRFGQHGDGRGPPPPPGYGRFPNGSPPRGFPPPGMQRLPLNNDPRFSPQGAGGRIPPFLPGGGGNPGGRLPFAPRLPPQGTVNFYENEIAPPTNLSALKTHLDDPAWPSMWFLNRAEADLSMNVEDAWDQGFTGKGVRVTILDDGIEVSHPDLIDNYDPKASIDLNDNDEDPSPRYDFLNYNKHGTRCAGTVAASANNSKCAVGIAYNAGVGGIRILDGPIVDMLEAKALSFNRDYIDIYSASWGPDDNGKTVDGPGKLARRAIEDGVEKGRNGKGTIFVWASGNGGKHADSCNCDGYTTSIYTLSVSSTSENGLIPWYSEKCSSSLATTYSSGSKTERKVVTTDLRGGCTNKHTGTSASSPMAAAIVALALEANPNLTWRDVQHLTVRTARPEGNLKGEIWQANGAGRKYSHAYGFGLMDAGAMTRMAKNWKTVPKQMKCTTPVAALQEPVVIIPETEEMVVLRANTCEGIRFIEHIHLHINLKTLARRGEISIMLISPQGTKSVLLEPRPKDDIRTGLDLFATWPMMSVHYWGESVNPDDVEPEWTLLVRNMGDREATLNDFQITFYGTASDPQPEDGSTEDRKDPQDEMTTIKYKESEVREPEITTFRPQTTLPQEEVTTFVSEFEVPEDVELFETTKKTPLKLVMGEKIEESLETEGPSKLRQLTVKAVRPESFVDFDSPEWRDAEILEE